MKTVGLLGGTSFISTPQYYLTINRLVAARLGGYHSANIILKSIDYQPIKSLYQGGRNEISPLLSREIRGLLALKPDCVILCNHSLHEALDESGIASQAGVPFFHAHQIAADHAHSANYQNLLALGTAYTMQSSYQAGFYQERGMRVIKPNEAEIAEIAEIQKIIATGTVSTNHIKNLRERLNAILIRYSAKCDAVILGCTELPLLYAETETPVPLPLIDPAFLQCEKAVDFALGGR